MNYISANLHNDSSEQSNCLFSIITKGHELVIEL